MSRRWEYIALWNSSSFLSLLQLSWVLEPIFPFSSLHVPNWTPRHHLYPTSPCYVFFRSTAWNQEEIKIFLPQRRRTPQTVLQWTAILISEFPFKPRLPSYFLLYLSFLVKLFAKIFFFGFWIKDQNRVQCLEMKHVTGTHKAFSLFTAVFKINPLWFAHVLCCYNYFLNGFRIKSPSKPRSGRSLVWTVIEVGGPTKVKQDSWETEVLSVWLVFHTNYLCFHF